MKARYLVLALAGGVLAPSLVGADCHEGKRPSTGTCRAAVQAYANAWSTGTFDPVLTEQAQLTLEESPRQTFKNKGNDKEVQRQFAKDWKALGENVKYTVIGDVDGSHVKVGGFLGIFGKTRFDNMAQLSWHGIVEGSKGRKREHVRAILLKTEADPKQPWQFVTLLITREAVPAGR